MPRKPAASPTFRLLQEAKVPLAKLQEDPQNANTHTEDNLAAIQASLQRFGQVERLVVRKSDGIVFAGNGRVEALRRMGTKTARVQYVEGTDAECRAYALAANQTTRLSRFNDEVLLANLKEIQEADTTGLLEATAFSLQDLQDLEAQLEDKQKAGNGKMPAGKGGAHATCPKCGETFRLGKGE